MVFLTPQEEMDLNDLCDLENPDDDIIVNTIKKRYECGYVYVSLCASNQSYPTDFFAVLVFSFAQTSRKAIF